MAAPDELMRSVQRYRAAAHAAHQWAGPSPIAELLQLEILIAKYPERARQILAQHEIKTPISEERI
jgi:hypothetical protein